MQKITPLSFSPLALALCLPMGDAVAADWSGSYYGGTLGYSVTNKKSNNTYNNDNGTPIQGWSNTQFQGDVYNTTKSMHFAEPANSSHSNVDTFALAPWPSGTVKDNNHNNMSATLLTGINAQYNEIIIGGELKLAFGGFGATSYSTENSTGNKSGTDNEGHDEPFIFINYNSVLSGITSPIDENNISYSATYQQNGSQKNSTKFKNRTALIARLGYSFGNLMAYGIGGASSAHVHARTQTTINEHTTGSVTANSGTTNFTAQKTYYFSGEKVKNMLGYTLGTGLEWDIKNNFRCRIEADYYNLGKINVTGTSSQTSATYNVNQKITGYGFSTGIIKKF